MIYGKIDAAGNVTVTGWNIANGPHLYSPDGKLHLVPCERCGRLMWMAPNVVSTVCAGCVAPVRSLTCNCCGGWTRGRQWHNRDTGYGMCEDCIKYVRERKMSEEEIHDLYGQEGVHWGVSE